MTPSGARAPYVIRQLREGLPFVQPVVAGLRLRLHPGLSFEERAALRWLAEGRMTGLNDLVRASVAARCPRLIQCGAAGAVTARERRAETLRNLALSVLVDADDL